jgi:hypothetical protein
LHDRGVGGRVGEGDDNFARAFICDVKGNFDSRKLLNYTLISGCIVCNPHHVVCVYILYIFETEKRGGGGVIQIRYVTYLYGGGEGWGAVNAKA